MTIFEWCDKNPDKELSFCWNCTGKEIIVSSIEYTPNPHACHYKFDDLNFGVFKEQLIRNGNVYVSICMQEYNPGIYELTFLCPPYVYKKMINRYEIERLTPIASDLIIEQIFDDAMKELSDAFLGRNK